MAHTFTVPTSPYDERLYLRKTVTFDPGMTVLVGCNGSGKTTLMRLIREQLEKDSEICVINYNDRADGGSHLMSKFGYLGNYSGLATMMMSSEGERIMMGIGDAVGRMRREIHNGSYREIWIFLDAVGSGLSIDGIREIKDLYNIIIEDNPDRKDSIYFVVSTNEYEFTVGVDCIDVTTFRHTIFMNYEDYRNYVMQTRKKKDKRNA